MNIAKKIAVSAVALSITCVECMAAVSVTASRDYVDRKTVVRPVTNDGEVVGYTVGTSAGYVMASKGYVDLKAASSTPIDYGHVATMASNSVQRTGSESIYGNKVLRGRTTFHDQVILNPLAGSLYPMSFSLNYGGVNRKLDLGFSSNYQWGFRIITDNYTTNVVDIPYKSGVLAIDGDVVHKSGDESISGKKSFTESVTVGSSYGTIGNYSFRNGQSVMAGASYSHAEGYSTQATASHAHAEGDSTTASGLHSHAEGYLTEASGIDSHAEGHSTVASGKRAHAEGFNSYATNNQSHAEGRATLAGGFHSHSEGRGSVALGNQAHAEGMETIAAGPQSHTDGYRSMSAGGGTGMSDISDPHQGAYVWQGVPGPVTLSEDPPDNGMPLGARLGPEESTNGYYHSHGHGTFNVNPAGGLSGFWIGETNLHQHFSRYLPLSGGGTVTGKVEVVGPVWGATYGSDLALIATEYGSTNAIGIAGSGIYPMIDVDGWIIQWHEGLILNENTRRWEIYDKNTNRSEIATMNDVGNPRQYDDVSVYTNRFLGIKPDGSHQWLIQNPENANAWYSGDMYLAWEGAGWAAVVGAPSHTTLIGPEDKGEDADVLVFSDIYGNEYKFVRGKRLAFDTEIPKVPEWALQETPPYLTSYTEKDPSIGVTNNVLFAKGMQVPTVSTVTNIVQQAVATSSRYIWDGEDECLYRIDISGGQTYETPVTNVNALLPENSAVLLYIEQHKEEFK